VQDKSVVTKIDQPAQLELAATDLDNDPLTYLIASQPSHGTLSGSGTNYLYQPQLGFLGQDSFTFQASDGKDLSPTATVRITVTDQNTPPVAHDFSVKVLVNTPTNITLQATDPESNPLNYHVASRPQNGKLTGKGEILIYSPNPSFIGADRFTFMVDDGELESEVATVSINVDSANHRPVTTNQTITVLRDTSTAIRLAVEDPDGDALHCPILKGPKNGRLAGLGTLYNYTPKAGYLGSDTFTYKAWDGQTYSLEGKVTITVASALPAADLRIEQVTVLASGTVQLTLKAPLQTAVEVLASSDLIEWTPLGQVQPSTEPISFLDPELAEHPLRFYQARQVPATP
jgi:hypothetical protein